jgi:hypothetical protein
VSTHAHSSPEVRLPAWSTPRGLATGSLGGAAVGLAGLLVGWFVDPRRTSFAYLDAWTFGVSLCLGSLLLLMMGHIAKASWTVVTRRIAEAIVSALPIYLVLFAPVLFALPHLYPWAADTRELSAPLASSIAHKRVYLNPIFFAVRTAFYFLVFVVVASLLRRWSVQTDTAPRIALVQRMRRLSGGAMPLVALAITWASFDWTMSLEPDWSSTIFGLYFFAGAFMGAIALVAILLHILSTRPGATLPVTPEHAYAVGRLLFAMVIFWAYMAFSQLLIYWIADLPDEVTFYARRSAGSWMAVAWVLVVGHFALPFLVLLSRPLKRRSGALAWAGAWLLLMHFVDLYWLILPLADPAGIRPHWLDLAALLFFGGTSVAWAAQAYGRRPELPRHVPELASGLDYEASL